MAQGQCAKAELLQLKFTPIIYLMNLINKKVGNRKNYAHFYYISFKSWILGELSFFGIQLFINKIHQANNWSTKKNTFLHEFGFSRITTVALKFVLDFFRLSTLQNSDYQSFFYVKNYPNLSKFLLSLKSINLGHQFLLQTFFDNFIF